MGSPNTDAAPAPIPPAFQLLQLLSALSGCITGNRHLLEDFVKSRSARRAMTLRLRNAQLKAASDRANLRMQMGESWEVATGELWALEEESESPRNPASEPSAFLDTIAQMLSGYRRFSVEIQALLKEGAGDALDAALSPGTAARTTEIGVRLLNLGRAVDTIEIGTRLENVIFDQAVHELAEHGEWLGRVRDELLVIVQTRGIMHPQSGNRGAGEATTEGTNAKGASANHKTPMKRLIPISAAAEPTGKRSDVLLKMLRTRFYPIHGPKGAYLAELEHIVATVPKRRRVIQRWADETYPPE